VSWTVAWNLQYYVSYVNLLRCLPAAEWPWKWYHSSVKFDVFHGDDFEKCRLLGCRRYVLPKRRFTQDLHGATSNSSISFLFVVNHFVCNGRWQPNLFSEGAGFPNEFTLHSYMCPKIGDFPTYCHDLGVDYRWGMERWMILLTTYTHHSELQVITALSLISTLYKWLQNRLSLFPASSVFINLSLATVSNSRDSSGSRTHVPSSQPPVKNSLSTLNSTTAPSLLSLLCRAQLNWLSLFSSLQLLGADHADTITFPPLHA
jgi:hypothetical protein